jgi:hypothetical protein
LTEIFSPPPVCWLKGKPRGGVCIPGWRREKGVFPAEKAA